MLFTVSNSRSSTEAPYALPHTAYPASPKSQRRTAVKLATAESTEKRIRKPGTVMGRGSQISLMRFRLSALLTCCFFVFICLIPSLPLLTPFVKVNVFRHAVLGNFNCPTFSENLQPILDMVRMVLESRGDDIIPSTDRSARRPGALLFLSVMRLSRC